MATDWWPSEEGAVFEDGAIILPCYPADTILECSCVKAGASSAGRITVNQSTALGDSIAVALRAGDTGVPAAIPVMFFGAVKMAIDNGSDFAEMFECVMNSITTTVTAMGQATTGTLKGIGGASGASHILGKALQAAAADGDEILVLVGRSL